MMIGLITAGIGAIMAFIYGLMHSIQTLNSQNEAYKDENERLRLRKMSEDLSDSDLSKRINDDLDKLK